MALTKVSRGLLSTGIVDNSNATAITLNSDESATFASSVTATSLIASNGVLELDDNGSHNGVINVPASLFINIDSDNGATGEDFVIAKDRTSTSGGTELFRAQEDGKIGIAGAISPNALLHVGGTAETQGSQANPAIQIGSTTGYRLGVYTDAEGGYIENKNGDNGLIFRVKTVGEAMRIDGGTGNVGIGVVPISEFHVKGDADTIARIEPNNNNGKATLLVSSTGSGDGGIQYNAGNNIMSLFAYSGIRFHVGTSNISGGYPANERVRLDNSGALYVNTTALSNGGTRLAVWAESGSVSIETRCKANVSYFPMANYSSSGSYIGGINATTTATSLATSSDRRLKSGIKDADDAGSKVDAIQVRQFNWIANNSHQDYGMVAQELQEVIPNVIHESPDAEKMLSVDYAGLVPMLVKEIQSLRARVAQLEQN